MLNYLQERTRKKIISRCAPLLLKKIKQLLVFLVYTYKIFLKILIRQLLKQKSLCRKVIFSLGKMANHNLLIVVLLFVLVNIVASLLLMQRMMILATFYIFVVGLKSLYLIASACRLISKHYQMMQKQIKLRMMFFKQNKNKTLRTKKKELLRHKNLIMQVVLMRLLISRLLFFMLKQGSLSMVFGLKLNQQIKTVIFLFTGMKFLVLPLFLMFFQMKDLQ